MFAMLQRQPTGDNVTKETVPSEISSTTDALAQLRLKHREESSKSGESKGPSLKDLEAEAAPFEQYQEEVKIAKTGSGGKHQLLANVVKFLMIRF